MGKDGRTPRSKQSKAPFEALEQTCPVVCNACPFEGAGDKYLFIYAYMFCTQVYSIKYLVKSRDSCKSSADESFTGSYFQF